VVGTHQWVFYSTSTKKKSIIPHGPGSNTGILKSTLYTPAGSHWIEPIFLQPFFYFLLNRTVFQNFRHANYLKNILYFQSSFLWILKYSTLQIKGWWESNINVWIPLMYSQKWNCADFLFPKQNYVLSPNFHFWERCRTVSFLGISSSNFRYSVCEYSCIHMYVVLNVYVLRLPVEPRLWDLGTSSPACLSFHRALHMVIGYSDDLW